MITIGSISLPDAADLLWTTAANTVTGRIGTPDGTATQPGYALADALALLGAGRDRRIETVNGALALTVEVPRQGRHTWYLCLTATTKDPWA